jgi:hypothetical protein
LQDLDRFAGNIDSNPITGDHRYAKHRCRVFESSWFVGRTKPTPRHELEER